MIRLAFALALVIIGLEQVARAQIQVDLAVPGTAAVSVWGAFEGKTGHSMGIDDFNGDGASDLVFLEQDWRGSLGQIGRACILFGPLPLPLQYDLLSDIPPVCIEGSSLSPQLTVSQLKVGDVDSDGVADVLLGSVGRPLSRGALAVIRGRALWPALMSISDADWIFYGAEDGDGLQNAVAGDVNGDGLSDLVLFASRADGPGNAREDSGEAYIFFGPASRWPAPEVEMGSVSADVVIYGTDGRTDNPFGVGGDLLGFQQAEAQIVDLSGDGIADLIAGAQGGSGSGNLLNNAGEVYVLYGRSPWPATVDLRVAGSADLVVYGPSASAYLRPGSFARLRGNSVLNLVLGARGYTPASIGRNAGSVLVLRGVPGGLRGIWDLATNVADATIVGPASSSGFGTVVATSDFNGDGYPDVIAHSVADMATPTRTRAGAIVVLSGCAELSGIVDLGTRPAELIVYGKAAQDLFGQAIALADIDGNGRSDLIGGAPLSRSKNSLRPQATGEIHIVQGREFASSCLMAAEAGPAGFICAGSDYLLDGIGTVTDCSVPPEFRWMSGSSVIQDWSTSSRSLVRPGMTTTYRMEVRCPDCARSCFDSSDVVVTVDADAIPTSLDNTLRAVRTGSDVDMQWGTVVEARSYSVFRGLLKDAWPLAPHVDSLAGAAVVLPDVSAPPNGLLYFYRVAGASCSGLEGP